ncbi:hypothetical protein B296_00050585 [Ensete ventricosum]|uniref:Uncharacterized protein n=1 Tax=Ensete ventricosum TaxID=4639 RepID=A0A426XUS5_ENSVE|nr:hypothetical protein B296_00050585 [Ensete ventricosum]
MRALVQKRLLFSVEVFRECLPKLHLGFEAGSAGGCIKPSRNTALINANEVIAHSKRRSRNPSRLMAERKRRRKRLIEQESRNAKQNRRRPHLSCTAAATSADSSSCEPQNRSLVTLNEEHDAGTHRLNPESKKKSSYPGGHKIVS